MQIGSFIRTATGYEGMIETATLDLRVSLVPTDKHDGDKAPDCRIHLGPDADGPEIGAGWNETGERAGEYVSLRIDDPAFAQPLRAALFRKGEDETSWVLRWSRPQPRPERD